MPIHRNQPWCSLSVADDERWHSLHGYRPDLARRLRYAYALLRDATLAPHPSERYLWVYIALYSYRDRWVCVEQRLRLLYALALAYFGEDMYQEALNLLSEAWEFADQMNDLSAQVELGYAIGVISHMLSQNDRSFWAYHDALTALRKLGRDTSPVDRQLELDLVQRSAWRAWELGVISACTHGLNEGYALLDAGVPDSDRERANLAWLDAQVSRLRGGVVRAVKKARTAAEIWCSLGSQINAGRTQIILAECAFDAAEVAQWLHGGRSAQTALPFYVPDLAARAYDPHTLVATGLAAEKKGFAIARAVDDAAGVGMARLARRRGRRLRSGTGTPVALHDIETVLDAARQRDDYPSMGRAWTSLGDEWLALDQKDAAALAYFRALSVLRKHECLGLARWPLAGLARLYP